MTRDLDSGTEVHDNTGDRRCAHAEAVAKHLAVGFCSRLSAVYWSKERCQSDLPLNSTASQVNKWFTAKLAVFASMARERHYPNTIWVDGETPPLSSK